MYDTTFIINTFELKQKIINRELSSRDRDYISQKLNAAISSKPFVFNIETTNVCNMSCVMCQRTTDFKQKLRHMDSKTYDEIIAQIEPQKESVLRTWQAFVNEHLRELDGVPSEDSFYFDAVSQSITLHGFGEPLLDPRLPERVSALSRKNILSYFSCNPCNIKLDLIKQLFEAETGYIKFAIDSLDDNEAKEIRGERADFKGSYQMVLEVLELKKMMKTDTVIVVTMLNFSGDSTQAAQFLELWKGKDVYAYVKSVDNKWLLENKGATEKTKGKNESHYKKQYCEYAWTSITILADGSVVPCTQDINGTWVFGNVNNESLRDIWNSKKYQKFRALQISKDYPEDFMCHSKCDMNIISYFFNDYEKWS